MAIDLNLLIFWAAAAAVAAGCAAWMLMSARRAVAGPGAPERDIYADQLDELVRDRDAGLIGAEAYEAARLEIGRRAAAALSRPRPVTTAGVRPVLIAALAAPVVALGVYLLTGRPDLPDRPFEERREELLARDPRSLSSGELIALLEDQTRRTPDDAQPHLFLGRALAEDGRDADALRAFQAAIRRDPRNVSALTEAGATIVRLSEGRVTDDALRAFSAAILAQPDNAPLARFYSALADYQRGGQDAALTQWRALHQSFPPDDGRRQIVALQIARALSELDRGPDAAAAARPMSDAERATFISGMVASRAARAAAAPRDLGLTLSLVRVQAMTGDRAGAEASLARLRAAYPGDPLIADVVFAARALAGLSQNDAPVSQGAPSRPG